MEKQRSRKNSLAFIIIIIIIIIVIISSSYIYHLDTHRSAAAARRSNTYGILYKRKLSIQLSMYVCVYVNETRTCTCTYSSESRWRWITDISKNRDMELSTDCFQHFSSATLFCQNCIKEKQNSYFLHLNRDAHIKRMKMSRLGANANGKYQLTQIHRYLQDFIIRI